MAEPAASAAPGQPAPACAFAFSVQGDRGAARRALREIRQRVAPWQMDIEELSTVEIVLAEVFNNIVEHAYPADLPEGPIEVAGRLRGNGLHVRIADEGCPMPDGRVPLGDRPSADLDLMDLPEGGFGWFLIRDLAKDVHYRRVGRRNLLDLRLPVAMGRV